MPMAAQRRAGPELRCRTPNKPLNIASGSSHNRKGNPRTAPPSVSKATHCPNAGRRGQRRPIRVPTAARAVRTGAGRTDPAAEPSTSDQDDKCDRQTDPRGHQERASCQ